MEKIKRLGTSITTVAAYGAAISLGAYVGQGHFGWDQIFVCGILMVAEYFFVHLVQPRSIQEIETDVLVACSGLMGLLVGRSGISQMLVNLIDSLFK
jgi:hypothetical protein